MRQGSQLFTAAAWGQMCLSSKYSTSRQSCRSCLAKAVLQAVLDIFASGIDIWFSAVRIPHGSLSMDCLPPRGSWPLLVQRAVGLMVRDGCSSSRALTVGATPVRCKSLTATFWGCCMSQVDQHTTGFSSHAAAHPWLMATCLQMYCSVGFGFRCGFLGLLHMDLVFDQPTSASHLSAVATPA